MNTDKLILTKALFKSKILELDGSAFELFFSKIMSKENENFRQIKPHGNNGDKKNDGFNAVTGEYYQVYSPEEPANNITTAVNKCKTSFVGLKEYWSKISPIKKYYFVFNDKYKGAFPEIEKVLSEIKRDNTELTSCEPFYAQHLEKKFFNLEENDMIEIIGYIPDDTKIGSVDFVAMKEVVEFLLKDKIGYFHDDRYVVPDFDEKIKFNNLDEQVKTLLTNGSYQSSAITDYFRNNHNFEKQKLKETFVNLYEKGQTEFVNTKNKDVLTFFYILSNAMPQNEKRIQDAVLVLMAYYFESCDIFEEPK